VFNLDTTKLANGLHTIAWGVSDDGSRVDGIGSRFFTVQNGASGLTPSGVIVAPAAELAWRSASASDVLGRAGFDVNAPLEPIRADAAGLRIVRMPELGRVELQLGDDVTAGYLRANDACSRCRRAVSSIRRRELHMDPWSGLHGTYDLVFLQGATQLRRGDDRAEVSGFRPDQGWTTFRRRARRSPARSRSPGGRSTRAWQARDRSGPRLGAAP
jgi:hypothetical protein